MKMQMKKSRTAARAWNILRLALLSATKGGLLRRRAVFNLHKYIKSLRGGDTFRYGERQLSFDDTPVIHVRMHRPSSLRFKLPHIPCINPAQVDFDFDFDDNNDDGLYYDNIVTKSFLEDDEQEYSVQDLEIYEDEQSGNNNIDIKADEFIAKFYAQMKMQRQISYLQYHDRSISMDA